jgi:hypothetical protein
MSLSDNVPKSVKKTGKAGTGTEASRWDHEHPIDPNLISQQVRVQKNDVEVGRHEIINIKEGANVTLTITDDGVNDRINVTITSSPGIGKIKTTLSFAVTGVLTTGTDKAPTLLAPCTLTITSVRLVVKTAPTGADLQVDVNKNGTSIFNAHGDLKIVAGATTGNAVPVTTALALDDKLTVDIVQIGSTIAGSDLTVEVVCDQAVTFT